MEEAATTGFGRMLRQWRARRRMSQLDLALEAGVSSRHVSFIETGRSRPSREMVCCCRACSTCPCATATSC